MSALLTSQNPTQLIAFFPTLAIRLSGIALASFSSGLGELTYLQLATRYKSSAGKGVGWFASGTGAAGLVGAAAWWIVRPLGVRDGLALLSITPWFMVASYLLILPSAEKVLGEEEIERGYASLPTAEEDNVGADADSEQEEEMDAPQPDTLSSPAQIRHIPATVKPRASVKLSFAEKMALLKPMLLIFILPLVLVYFFEYTINQGVAPTLLYPLPKSSQHPLLSMWIKELKDYYPLYQLTYQTFVFLSRSSISLFHLPAIPKEWLWAPALLQGGLLAVLTTESLYAWFRASIASPITIVLICVEGLAGGYAYVSVFYQIGMSPSTTTTSSRAGVRLREEDTEEADVFSNGGGDATASDEDAQARAAQEHEFRIGCVGVGDSFGILLASIIAMPLELQLCAAQVAAGRTLCKQV